MEINSLTKWNKFRYIKGTLVDYFLKNNEAGREEEETQTPGKSQVLVKPKNQEEKPEDSQKSQELEKAGKHQEKEFKTNMMKTRRH
ncbi:hypothetical protein JTB14_008763 [Gonioctena quinquepunctata]|nr:hypothetical protein JTB14_008763 [Gonioctena quinquepunctata]